MNIKLYNAALTQLRGKALESLAIIDMYLNDPTMVPDHSSLVEEIINHAKTLSEYESAFGALQQYFQPAPAAAPVKAPTPVKVSADVAPISEEELMKRSPAFRKSVAGKSRAKKKQKPDLYESTGKK